MPFAGIPLVVLTHNRKVMGPLANRFRTTTAACGVAVLVIGLNCYLVSQILFN
ncbi:hypothetical protein [Streptomyces prunicolor]